MLTAGTVSTSEPSTFTPRCGWVEGENLIIERRGAAGKSEAAPTFAAELVRLNPDVITPVVQSSLALRPRMQRPLFRS